jgi:hypothetical protein
MLQHVAACCSMLQHVAAVSRDGAAVSSEQVRTAGPTAPLSVLRRPRIAHDPPGPRSTPPIPGAVPAVSSHRAPAPSQRLSHCSMTWTTRVSTTRVAPCCSMLQHVAACCRMLPHVAACYRMLPHVAACCSMLQHVAACCSMLQHAASPRHASHTLAHTPSCSKARPYSAAYTRHTLSYSTREPVYTAAENKTKSSHRIAQRISLEQSPPILPLSI